MKASELIKEALRQHDDECMLCAYKDTQMVKALAEVKKMETESRCPCGGKIIDMGISTYTKKYVYECLKCKAQIEVNPQALKGNHE